MPLLLHDYRPEIVGQARLFMVFAPQCLLWYAVGAFLEARGDFLRSIFGQLVPNLVTLSALLALAATHRLTPLTSSLAYAVPPALQTLVLFARLWPAMAADGARFGADVRALLGYGLRSYGTEVINGLSAQLDMAVIVAFLSPAALGLYGVALSLARLVNVVQQSVVVVLFPHASGLADAAAIDLVQRAARVSFVLSIALGGSFLLIIAQLLPVLYGPAFSGALAIMPLLTLEAILSGLATVLAQAFSATGRPGIVTLIQAGWIVVVVALLYLLVPHLRLSGAALALMLAGAVRVALVFAAYRRLLKRPFPALLPNAGDVAYIRAKLAALAGRRQPLRAQPEH
jgi:O-antigen/teichoic acid export membrane protein